MSDKNIEKIIWWITEGGVNPVCVKKNTGNEIIVFKPGIDEIVTITTSDIIQTLIKENHPSEFLPGEGQSEFDAWFDNIMENGWIDYSDYLIHDLVTTYMEIMYGGNTFPYKVGNPKQIPGDVVITWYNSHTKNNIEPNRDGPDKDNRIGILMDKLFELRAEAHYKKDIISKDLIVDIEDMIHDIYNLPEGE